RRDVLAAADDQLLHAPGEIQVAVGVLAAEVAGVEPALADRRHAGATVTVVATHHRRPGDHDLALLARRRQRAVGATDADQHVRVRTADGTVAVEDAGAAG